MSALKLPEYCVDLKAPQVALFIITTGFDASSLKLAIADAMVACAMVEAVIAGTPTEVVVETVPQASIATMIKSAHFLAILYANSS